MEDSEQPRGPSARDVATLGTFAKQFREAPDADTAEALNDIDTAMDTWLPPATMARLMRTLHEMHNRS